MPISNDREVHTCLPLPIARFREAAIRTIHDHAKQFDDVTTVAVDDGWLAENFAGGTADAMGGPTRASTMKMSTR